MAGMGVHKNYTLLVTLGTALLLSFMLMRVEATTTKYPTTSRWTQSRPTIFTTTPFWSNSNNSTILPVPTPATAAPTPATAAPTPATAAPVTPGPATQTPTTAAPTTVTTGQTTTTAVTLSPDPITAATLTPKTHFQFVANKQYSELGNLEKIEEELKPQLAAMCGVLVSRITHIVLAEGNDLGNLVVTFDVEPTGIASESSIPEAFNKFSTYVSREETIKVNQITTDTKMYTNKKWTDDSFCSQKPCTNNTRCWINQQMYTCVCMTCPTTPAGSTGGFLLDKTIVIAVVASVVALVIIIIVVVCILKSSRRKREKDDVSEGSQYSNTSSEHYHTHFDYAAD